MGGASPRFDRAGVGSQEEKELHINILEVKTVVLALNAFLGNISGESVVLVSNNTTVVTYLKNQGGTMSKVLCNLAQDNVVWTDSLGSSNSKVHSRKEEHSGGPAELP